MGRLKAQLILLTIFALYAGVASAQDVFERLSPEQFTSKGLITKAQASRILRATGLISCGKGSGTAIVVGRRTVLTVAHLMPDSSGPGSNGVCTFLPHGQSRFVNLGIVAAGKLPWALEHTLNGEDWVVMVAHEDIKGSEPISLLERAIETGDFDDIRKTELIHTAYHRDIFGGNFYEPKVHMSKCRLPDMTVHTNTNTFTFFGDCFSVDMASGSGIYRVDGENIHLVGMQTGTSLKRKPTDAYIKGYLATLFTPIGKDLFSAIAKANGH